MDKDAIKAKLDAAGIEYDARRGADKLAAMLPTETVEAPKSQTVACVVLRDYWPAEDDRVRAGTIVDLEPMDAIDGIESGLLSRVKG